MRVVLDRLGEVGAVHRAIRGVEREEPGEEQQLSLARKTHMPKRSVCVLLREVRRVLLTERRPCTGFLLGQRVVVGARSRGSA